MKNHRASRTAQSMAMFRALESARPPSQRLFTDQLALHFLRPSMRFAVQMAERSAAVHSWLAGMIDQRWPGARPSAVARTMLIDRLLREALLEGIGQVVILGAGYDSRACRIEEMTRAQVFEVDKSETQRLKREHLSRVFPSLSSRIVFIETDFTKQTLGEVLTSSGFDLSRRTFFIWEGVTNYLNHEAVDSTLRFVGRCAAGGAIAFTYIDRGLLDGSGAFAVSANVLRLLKQAGEPWTFGFYPSELDRYLHARNLELMQDLGAAQYGAQCMGASPKQMKGYEFYHVALARIRSQEVAVAESK